MISPIKGFEGYFIDESGTVYSIRSNKHKELVVLHQRTDKDGYKEVGLYRDGKRFFRRVHRLVAETFIPNPNHLPQVNHKDGNLSNNCVENLEWCTCQDNLLHSFRILKRKHSITTAKAVKLINKVTNEILYFSTEKDCAFYLNMSHEHLNKLLTGKKDVKKWKKGSKYKVEFVNVEDVTTSSQSVHYK